MKELNEFPKSLKKAVRYINQDASKEKLLEIKRLTDHAIRIRNYSLK